MMKVDTGSKKDRKKIMLLQDELFGDKIDLGASTKEYVKYLLDKCDGLIVVRDDEIIGYSFYKITDCSYVKGERLNTGFYKCPEKDACCCGGLLIMDIGVTKSHQNMGVGSMILEALVDRANENDADRIFLNSWNNSPGDSSYNFFKKHGFEEKIIIKEYYGKTSDSRAMCKFI